MPHKTKTFKQLLEQYSVHGEWSSIDSNLVYPMDSGTKFKFHGYINEEDVQLFIDQVYNATKKTHVSEIVNRVPNRIANKYAIPCLQVGQMHTVQTFFYYQHDDKTWLISLSEDTKEYMG
jgi:hypothetical protein